MPKPMLDNEKKRELLSQLVTMNEKDVEIMGSETRTSLFAGIAVVISIALFGLLILTNERFDLFRQGIEKQPDIVDEPLDEVFPYELKNVGTYVGDASKVGTMLRSLEGGDTMENGISLKDQIITVHYSPKESWFEGDYTIEQKLLYNTIYLSIFVPNTKGFHFSVGELSFSITRDEMAKIMSEKLVDFPKRLEDFWDKEIMFSFLEKNKQVIIRDMIESEDFIEQFYSEHPIIEE